MASIAQYSYIGTRKIWGEMTIKEAERMYQEFVHYHQNKSNTIKITERITSHTKECDVAINEVISIEHLSCVLDYTDNNSYAHF